MTKCDVIVIGGGAAGLWCAIEAAKRGRSVILLERAPIVGKKILISGGGRCNFTNLHTESSNFLSDNVHFAKSALARFTPNDFIAVIQKHDIRYHEKKLGQLFCDHSAKEIVEMLLKECEQENVVIHTSCTVTSVEKAENFTVNTNYGVFSSQKSVIATGGLSYSKLCATDFGHKLAKQFGISLVEQQPALVPLLFDKKLQTEFESLSGISIDCEVSIGKTKFRENILFTHRGLSGPAILQISSYWKEGAPVVINFSPERDIKEYLLEQKRKNPKMELKNVLRAFFPERFIEKWCSLYAPSQTMGQCTLEKINMLASQLHRWTFTPAGTEGYDKAEVTVGGVSTEELSSQTMEAKKVPGLYFIGEVVDVTGHLGGFNFQWAWASAHACAQAL